MFVTNTGLVVMADLANTGTGTMNNIAASTANTLNGVTTTASATGHIIDDDAVFDATVIGAMVYICDGTAVGTWLTVTAQSDGDLSTDGATSIPIGSRYAVSPILFRARMWSIPTPPDPYSDFPLCAGFVRKVMTGIGIAVQALVGITSNPNRYWRLGAFANGSDVLLAEHSTLELNENTSESFAPVSVAGSSVEPYIEQCSSTTLFELTGVEIGTTMSISKKVSD
jgi:hypothetical protein